ALQALIRPIDGLLSPLAHGRAPGPLNQPSYFVISRMPPGPPLAAQPRPWPEAALLDQFLRPAALVLEQLQAVGVTHRAIRLNNLFQAAPGHPIVLGQAWAAPPAMHQPAVHEPPYSGSCLPAGRGAGSIADDVYALGVTLLALALGRVPLAELDEAAVVRRKLERGSHAALIGDERLPPVIADLVRGMLAEDPEHRPTPTLLLDPAAARGRRVAARPPRHAQHGLTVAGVQAWDARTLANAVATEPDQGLHVLRNGTALQWLRREVGDAGLAARIEELLRHRLAESGPEETRSDALLTMRAVSLLDPLAPLCWRGLNLWPDGLGTALAAAQDTDPASMARLEELVATEAISLWATARPDRCDFAMLRVEARQNRAWLQTGGLAGGLPRLLYGLNPLVPCLSPLTASRWVARLNDVLPALEAAIAANPKLRPMDAHVAGFIAARTERGLDAELNMLAAPKPAVAEAAQLRLLAQIQAKLHREPLPALAAWLAEQTAPLLKQWHNRAKRAELEHGLRDLAQAGLLAPMLALVDDPAGRNADAQAAQVAANELVRIDAELSRLSAGTQQRAMQALRFGQELAAGIGLTVLATVLAIAVLS
ncbi:MAG TPA: hypothetical protein VFN42_04265, partial [Acetobacteraceae bacterium]|nr:hypothetical protein [Acetobacteraceae bacterium]